jgi:hypothetical protein
MLNPLESRPVQVSAEEAPKLSRLMEGLITLLRTQHVPHWGGQKVHVPELAAGAYFMYEQLRNAVEYRERHLFLRGAIERFLLRELRTGPANGLGLELVTELTKTRYLKNDDIYEDQVDYVDYVIGRYGALQRAANDSLGAEHETVANHIVQLLSVELARILQPNPTEASIVEFTYASFLTHADVSDADRLALYAAVHRSLLKSDIATIRYGMFSRAFPRWLEDEEQLAQAGNRFAQFQDQIEEYLQGSRPQRMFRLVRRYIAPYLVLREIIKTSNEGLDELASKPNVLLEKARAMAENQYQVVSHRLKRSVIQAIIFLFITKMLIGLLIEIPYELFTYGEINYLTLAINLVFPPLYMAMVGFTIKIPGKRNTTKILSDLKRIVYETDRPMRYSLNTAGRPSKLKRTFSMFYGLTSILTLALISWALAAIGFNIVSGIIFFVFLSTVSFFAYRISSSVREYAVIEENPGFIAALTDFLLTPFIRAGQWLAEHYSRINIFSTILDIIIETPFKTVLRLIEQWNTFLREKRDDVLR